MAKLIDDVWLWGQPPGSHHVNPDYRLPGANRTTPIEGCDFFGIDRCCRVAMSAGPFTPFDNEAAPLDRLSGVSVVHPRRGGVQRNENKFGDLDEVIRIAKAHPNVVGGIMDDFLLGERRRAIFTPDKLWEIKKNGDGLLFVSSCASP